MSTRARVHRLDVSGVALVAKSGRGSERQRLRQEAELLEHLRGLPVVELVTLRDSDDRTDLVTVDAGDRDLSDLSGLSPAQILRALAETAEAMVELHASGWAHGALCAQHVVLGGEGTVRLCSLGSASVLDRTGSGPSAPERTDRLQLRALVDNVLAHRSDTWSLSTTLSYRASGRRIQRELARGRASEIDEDRTCSLTDLAELLHDVAAASDGGPQSSRLSKPPLRLVGAAVGVGVIGLTWGAVAAEGRSGEQAFDTRPAPLSTGEPESCTPIELPSAGVGPDLDEDDCLEQVEVLDNVVTVGEVRFRAGEPGDQVVVAPIDCTGDPQVVLLRPASSEVFTFDEWPGTTGAAHARLIGRYPGAVSLEVQESQGCIRAVPLDSGGSPAPEDET